MATYQIISTAGRNLGRYEAQDERAALDAMARNAGYDSHDHATEVAGPFEGFVEDLTNDRTTRYSRGLR